MRFTVLLIGTIIVLYLLIASFGWRILKKLRHKEFEGHFPHFEAIARKLNADVQRETIEELTLPRIEFKHNDRLCVLRFVGGGSRIRLDVPVRPESAYPFEIAPEARDAQWVIEKLAGRDDIKTGAREFDRRFSVRSENELWMRGTLGARLREAMMALKSRVDDVFAEQGYSVQQQMRTVEVRSDGNVLMIERAGSGIDFRSLEVFVDAALEVVDAFPG